MLLVFNIAMLLLLLAAISLREYHIGRERAANRKLFNELRVRIARERNLARKLGDELYVLESLLVEHHVLSPEQIAKARVRLVEKPRRKAQERSSLLRDQESSSSTLVVDDTTDNIH